MIDLQTDLQTCAVIVFLVCPQLGFARSLRPGEKVRPVAAAALLLTSLFQGSLSCGGAQVARHITLVSVSALPTPVSHLGDTALASHPPPATLGDGGQLCTQPACAEASGEWDPAQASFRSRCQPPVMWVRGRKPGS